MDYQLMIKIPFSEMDDIAARFKAKDIIEKIQVDIIKKVKLQRLEGNKEPIGIVLDTERKTK